MKTDVMIRELKHTAMCNDVIPKLELLKAYEDIGPTPEQLLEIDKMYMEKCEEVNRLKERNIEIIAKMKSELERYYYLWNDSKEDSLYNEGRADAMQEALNIMRSDEK